MAGGGDYQRYCRIYEDVSGALNITSGMAGPNHAVALRTNHTIFLQKIHIEVTTGNAQTWNVVDTAGSPVNLVPSVSTSAIAHFDFDFGPRGIPLTESFGLDITESGAGAVGWVSWEAYRKLTKVDKA